MGTGFRYCIIIVALWILLPGCSFMPKTGSDAVSTGSDMQAIADPGIDPALDHFIAWLPYQLADTATQARALTHVAIGRAKLRAGHRQCDMPWLITGAESGSSGPRPVKSGGKSAWYYRISLQPGLKGCENVSRDELYEALQQELPGWITLQRAGARMPSAGATPLVKASR